MHPDKTKLKIIAFLILGLVINGFVISSLALFTYRNNFDKSEKNIEPKTSESITPSDILSETSNLQKESMHDNSNKDLTSKPTENVSQPSTNTNKPTENVSQPSKSSHFSIDEWNNSLRKVILSDVTQSVKLPDGRILWVFGDTTKINGVSVVGVYTYPKGAFVIQNPGTLNFTPVKTPYTLNYQTVPNWDDKTYFWMTTPFVEGNTLYVTGQRIKGVNPFTIVGQYIASFDASSLAFKSITEIPASFSTTSWSGIVKVAGGWWIAGTRGVPCYYSTNCNVGDIAFIPDGKILAFSDWQITPGVISEKENMGVGLALIKNNSGWTIFNKRGGMYGGTELQRFNAISITGPWTETQKWPLTSPAGTYTYAVAVHTSQLAPDGQALVSYNVSEDSDKNNDTYYARFMYLPLK